MNFESTNIDMINSEEMKNLSSNIIFKKNQLQISLQELSRRINISYQLLVKIANNEPVMPSLTTLNKIANFFGIKIGDLLNYGELPQYVPKFDVKKYSLIENHLSGEENLPVPKEFVESFINKRAFAIDLQTEIYSNYYDITFIFSPATEFQIGKYYLIKLHPNIKNEKSRYFFIEILNENHGEIIANILSLKYTNSKETVKFNLKNISILGLAVRQKLNSKI